MIISTRDKLIEYISHSCSGRVHDYKLLKISLNAETDWFLTKEILVDSGYTGFDKDYKTNTISIPYKKTKNKPSLSDEEKEHNRAIAKKRIFVENSISGLKRYRILSNKLRMHLIDLYDEVLGVCAGLWNFNLYN